MESGTAHLVHVFAYELQVPVVCVLVYILYSRSTIVDLHTVCRSGILLVATTAVVLRVATVVPVGTVPRSVARVGSTGQPSRPAKHETGGMCYTPLLYFK